MCVVFIFCVINCVFRSQCLRRYPRCLVRVFLCLFGLCVFPLFLPDRPSTFSSNPSVFIFLVLIFLSLLPYTGLRLQLDTRRLLWFATDCFWSSSVLCFAGYVVDVDDQSFGELVTFFSSLCTTGLGRHLVIFVGFLLDFLLFCFHFALVQSRCLHLFVWLGFFTLVTVSVVSILDFLWLHSNLFFFFLVWPKSTFVGMMTILSVWIILSICRQSSKLVMWSRVNVRFV